MVCLRWLTWLSRLSRVRYSRSWLNEKNRSRNSILQEQSRRSFFSRGIVSVQTWPRRLWLESSRGWMWRPLCGIRIWNFNFLLNWRLAKMNTFTPDTMNRSNRRLSKKLFCEDKIFKNFTIAKYKWDYYIITYIFCCSFSLKKKNLFLLK